MSQTIGEALLAYQNEKIIEKMSKNVAIKAGICSNTRVYSR